MTKSTFASLPVAEPIKAAIREVMGYECMTAVQEASIPVSLKGGMCEQLWRSAPRCPRWLATHTHPPLTLPAFHRR